MTALHSSPCNLTQQPEAKSISDGAGRPIPGTSLRVVDPESYQDVADGQQGVILAQGPGVMKGYYNDPQGTQKAFPDSGWFDTGDLGWRAPGVLVLSHSSFCLSLFVCLIPCQDVFPALSRSVPFLAKDKGCKVLFRSDLTQHSKSMHSSW